VKLKIIKSLKPIRSLYKINQKLKDQNEHYQNGYCRGGASAATSSGGDGGSLSCLLCKVLCVGKGLEFNHKIMINVLGVAT